MYIINLPLNFNPKIHLPAKLWRYADYGKLFLDLLIRKTLYTKRKWHRLKASYLRESIHFRKFNHLRDALIASGVIGFNPVYVVGSKCRSYCLMPEFNKEKVQEEVKKKSIIKRLCRAKQDQWDTKDSTLCALDAWCKKLVIDEEGARHTLGMAHRKRHHKWWAKSLSLDLIVKGELGLYGVDSRGRVYNNLTSLWSKFRKHLRIDGEKLVNIDVSCSQPLILSSIIKQDCLSLSPSLYSLSHNDVHYGTLKEDSKHDIELFKYLCETGGLYAYLGQVITKAGMKALNKPAMKRKVFTMLYGRNSTRSEFKDIFTKTFPSVAKFIHDAKRTNYKELPLRMQAKEAQLMIQTICKRLTVEYPRVPLLTIHDSIMTTEQNEALVKKVMLEEFRKVGINPYIRSEQ